MTGACCIAFVRTLHESVAATAHPDRWSLKSGGDGTETHSNDALVMTILATT